MPYIKAPKTEKQIHYDYLEVLRQSGETNMFGACSYLVRAFGLSNKDASKILSDWMQGHSDQYRVLPDSYIPEDTGEYF